MTIVTVRSTALLYWSFHKKRWVTTMRIKRDDEFTDGAPTKPVRHFILEPKAIMSLPQAEEALGLDPGTLMNEVKRGYLKIFLSCGRRFVTGEQIEDILRIRESGAETAETLTLERLRLEEGIFLWAEDLVGPTRKMVMKSGPRKVYIPIKNLARALSTQYGDKPFPLPEWRIAGWLGTDVYPFEVQSAINCLVEDGVLEFEGPHWFDDKEGNLYFYRATDNAELMGPPPAEPSEPTGGQLPAEQKKRKKGDRI